MCCREGSSVPCGTCSFISLWNTLGLDKVKRSKHCPHSEAENLVACLSGNGAAVGDGSMCVCLWFSGSSKIYTGPHPVLSVHCVPWCPPLKAISQVW